MKLTKSQNSNNNNEKIMINRILFKIGVLAAITMLATTTLQAQREMKTINDNWEFRKPMDEKYL